MALKYQGDALFNVGLTVQTPKPLDSRTVVNSIEDLYTIPSKYAYEGMTVANANNGNIYMLVDKKNIDNKSGWKASYESIQIITCTEAEYKEWKENTDESYNPIDETKDYLHADTYYYIYEDSIDDKSQQYLSWAWGEEITKQLAEKALSSEVKKLRELVNTDITNLSDNYLTSEQTATSISSAITELTNSLPDTYYNKSEVDDKFVTKESLRGGDVEGDDFVFVTKKQYDSDQETLQETLDTKVTTNSDAVLNSVTVGTIKNDGSKDITLQADGVYRGDSKLAETSEIPKLVCLSQDEYSRLEVKDPDTYYYTYGESKDDSGYVTAKDLEANYYSKRQVEDLMNKSQGQWTVSNEVLSFSALTEITSSDNNILTDINDLILKAYE